MSFFNVGNGTSGSGGKGADGKNGLSAYEIAVIEGFSGTRQEWLDSLKVIGEGGSAFEDAPSNGLPHIRKDNEWVEFEIPNNETAIDDVTDSGFYARSKNEWVSIDVANGKDAYTSALENGFDGTEEEWIESLKGKKGESGSEGQSAYDIALINGFNGTEEEWIKSLKGEKGEKGEKGSDAGLDYEAENVEMKNQPDGYAGLDEAGILPRDVLPPEMWGNFEMGISLTGGWVADEVLFVYISARNYRLSASLEGSKIYKTNYSNSELALAIRKNGTQVGIIDISNQTFILKESVDFNVNDLLSITAENDNSEDIVAVTLIGERL